MHACGRLRRLRGGALWRQQQARRRLKKKRWLAESCACHLGPCACTYCACLHEPAAAWRCLRPCLALPAALAPLLCCLVLPPAAACACVRACHACKHTPWPLSSPASTPCSSAGSGTICGRSAGVGAAIRCSPDFKPGGEEGVEAAWLGLCACDLMRVPFCRGGVCAWPALLPAAAAFILGFCACAWHACEHSVSSPLCVCTSDCVCHCGGVGLFSQFLPSLDVACLLPVVRCCM